MFKNKLIAKAVLLALAGTMTAQTLNAAPVAAHTSASRSVSKYGSAKTTSKAAGKPTGSAKKEEKTPVVVPKDPQNPNGDKTDGKGMWEIAAETGKKMVKTIGDNLKNVKPDTWVNMATTALTVGGSMYQMNRNMKAMEGAGNGADMVRQMEDSMKKSMEDSRMASAAAFKDQMAALEKSSSTALDQNKELLKTLNTNFNSPAVSGYNSASIEAARKEAEESYKRLQNSANYGVSTPDIRPAVGGYNSASTEAARKEAEESYKRLQNSANYGVSTPDIKGGLVNKTGTSAPLDAASPSSPTRTDAGFGAANAALVTTAATSSTANPSAPSIVNRTGENTSRVISSEVNGDPVLQTAGTPSFSADSIINTSISSDGATRYSLSGIMQSEDFKSAAAQSGMSAIRLDMSEKQAKQAIETAIANNTVDWASFLDSPKAPFNPVDVGLPDGDWRIIGDMFLFDVQWLSKTPQGTVVFRKTDFLSEVKSQTGSAYNLEMLKTGGKTLAMPDTVLGQWRSVSRKDGNPYRYDSGLF